MRKFVLFFLFFAITFNNPIKAEIYPIAFFHGINDHCRQERMEKLSKDLNTYVECIEVGTGQHESIAWPMFKQAYEACKSIKSNPHFQGKFSIFGESQGTLIGRYIIESCNMKGQVVRYLSLNGPQMGIGQIPFLTCGVLCDVFNYVTLPLIANFTHQFSFASYFRSKYDLFETYNKYDVFIRDLNNEFEEKNEYHYAKFSSLEKAIFIKSKNDSIITPRDSSWFEFYDEKAERIVPLNESDFYIKDYIGLRKLHEEGKASFVEFEGEHVKYTEEEYKNVILKFFLE